MGGTDDAALERPGTPAGRTRADLELAERSQYHHARPAGLGFASGRAAARGRSCRAGPATVGIAGSSRFAASSRVPGLGVARQHVGAGSARRFRLGKPGLRAGPAALYGAGRAHFGITIFCRACRSHLGCAAGGGVRR